MNKKDFLNELENALSGRLSESDISEIIADYGDIFDHGTEAGKNEEETAKEIGSPAKIARTILDGMGREYTDFQKDINEKTGKIFDRVIEPERGVATDQLAPMSRRVGAYVIDCLLLGLVSMGVFIILLIPFSMVSYNNLEVHTSVQQAAEIGGTISGNGMMRGWAGPRFAVANMLVLVVLFGVLNLFTTIFLWATNGYTPGKWLLKMRVIKIGGGKISFLDAILRELLIKGIANSVLSGILNIISLVWGCVTEDHKTVHDLAVRTRVVEWDRAKESQWIHS